MKRFRILYILPVLAFLLSLTGCCMHSWTEATCTEPKTCSKCGATEGTAKGHTFHEATCNAPKTCEICGYTEGEKLEHHFLEATCEEPETCEYCGETRGEALGHTTGLGICERCGEKQTTKSILASEIRKNITQGINYLTDGLNDMSTAYSMSTDTYIFEYTYKAYTNFLLATVPLEFARDICEGEIEFADAQKELQAICDGLASLKEWETLSSSDLSKINTIHEKISPHVTALFDITEKWTSFLE